MAGSRAGIPNKHKPFRAALERAIDQAGRDPDRLDRVAAALLAKAEEGDVQAIKEVADRLDGKSPQAHTGEDGGPIAVSWFHAES